MKDHGKYKDDLLRMNKELREENELLKATLFDWGITDSQKPGTKFKPTEGLHTSIPLTAKDGFWQI